MFKKILLSSIAFTLVACSSESQPDYFPGEFANADYILSETDAQRWAQASRQVEQCIYPNLTRIQYEHFAKEDAYIYSQYVYFYPLEDIIGEQYVKIIQDDEKSMGYATYLYKKVKADKVKALDSEQCQTLRNKAKDDLAVVKGQYKSGMVEDAKTDKITNSDGVATGQNKFFFDIIKWGAALLL
ncbi:hypothetical protein BMT54_03970 [Pasteurellaceae bacterium 15-036681]|nr:hypothetical protein BMT54_03970 [Pasteurellaceae bacterium 15-036681]